MSLLQFLKKQFHKEGFDYFHGSVDPHKFYAPYYWCLKVNGVSDTESMPWWTRPNQIVTYVLITITQVLIFISVYHSMTTNDIMSAAECGSYFIVLSYQEVIMYTTKANITEYHVLQRIIREDFDYICTRGQRFRFKFFENQLLTWKAVMCFGIFTQVMSFGATFSICGLLMYHIPTYVSGDTDSRLLLFPIWYGEVDFRTSPFYELTYIFFMVVILTLGYTYAFMILTQIVWTREISLKADITTWCILDLMDDIHHPTNKYEEENVAALIKERMREVIQQHLSMYTLLENYATVHKKYIYIEQSLSSPTLCLSAYGFSERLNEGVFNAVLLLLCISIIIVIFIPSYLCTIMTIKIRSVADACWDVPFWRASRVLRPYLVLIIHRSQRPLPLKCIGFKDVCLETFSQTMTTAYTYFNLLRNMDI